MFGSLACPVNDQGLLVGGTRLEQTTSSSKKTGVLGGTDAPNDAQSLEVALIAARWSVLDTKTRAKILKLVVQLPL